MSKRLRSTPHHTERQQMEAALRESEEKYCTLFEESRDAIYVTSCDGAILAVNQAALELFGYTRAEVIGLNAQQTYVNPDDRLRFQEAIERQGAVHDYELQLRKKDGAVMHCHMSATARRAPAGRILGYQRIIRDITEQKRMQRLLEDHSRTLEHQVEERTRELQANNVHLQDTLRQVLMKHQQFFAADTFVDIEDILYSLDQNVLKIAEHGQCADRIVTGMLQHSRGQAGEREPTDLNILLAEYINLVYHGMRAQDTSFHVSIDTHYDPSIGLVEVVPQDVGRVFLNVLNHACYAVHTKHQALGEALRPTLSVRTANLGDRVEIRIRDNGDGMTPEVRTQLFRPFFTTKPAGVGTGLGLSISHDIVMREHRGTISVATAVGKYAEFIIAFPRQSS